MKTIFALVLTMLASVAVAQEPLVFDNPEQEARYIELTTELRCMVCQNQSIDDSDAPLARDLRILLRERLEAGDSDSEVIDFLVFRYGEFVLLKPRFNGKTALLWIAPPAALVIGGMVAFALFRRRRQIAEVKPLEEAEKQRLAAIIGKDQ